MRNESLVLEQESPYSVEKTVEMLTKNATDANWNVPAVHDLKQSLAKSGKTVKPVQVVEICKPEYSGQLLERNHERIMSVLMPCRISVYEKDDGKTYIALMNMGLLTPGMPDLVAE